MTPGEKIAEWQRYVEACFTLRAKVEGLQACLERDGEEVLEGVLKRLGWERTVAVLKAAK